MNWQVSNFHTMRAALRKMCLALEQDAVAENSVFDCKLIASELLCNALRYGGGCTAFEAELRADERVFIRVRSANNFCPPASVQCSDADAEQGRGLFLVDALSESRTFSEEEGVCVLVRIALNK